MIPENEQVVLHKKKVISNKEISPGVFYLTFDKTGDFVAGQTVAVGVDPGIEPRLYSLASGMNDKRMSILYIVVADGTLTPKLAELSGGDELYVSKAFGTFYGSAWPSYWIASGTGIAPYYSMFYSGLTKNKVLIHGGRTLDSFYFADEFKPFFGDNYIRCCSRERGDGVYEGRLTQYLKEKNYLPPNYKYYLCGSSEMVVEARDILINKGIPFQNILAEIYF
ncbi:MAG: hypothetical protein K9I74_14060 [Bacteroidales bacterium]|nr:hypothetical protein [Bacteroidales bacterium]